jgi:hypothetical protein
MHRRGTAKNRTFFHLEAPHLWSRGGDSSTADPLANPLSKNLSQPLLLSEHIMNI